MSSSSIEPDDPTTAWAKDAVAGKFVIGELVQHAAERHLRDLRDGGKRGLVWSPAHAGRVLRFMPGMLTITEGSHEGRPFNPLPWQVFAAGSLFGWRNTSGRMRFRSGWLETGKGQAKSPFMAAIGLFMAGFYGIPRAKAFAIGQDRSTANVLFKDAVAMCRAPIPVNDGEKLDASDTLVERGVAVIRGEFDNAWKIEFPESGSLFQSLANGEAVSGPKPTLVAADEIHEFKSSSSIETWKAAIAKMPGDALMLLGTNTPASNQIVGTEYSEFYQKVAKGEILDDEAFAFVARVDAADRETVFDNEACWPKALPALGVTFPIENVRGMVTTARALLSTALSTKRLYFGIPVGTAGFWTTEEAWVSCQGEFDIADMVGLPCWLGLDLSKKNDLTALSACWRGERGGRPHLFVKTWYFTTKAGLADRARDDNAPYLQWSEGDRYLTATPGATIDYEFVAARVKALDDEHDVQFLAFDAAKIGDFIDASGRIDFPAWKFEGPDKPAGVGLRLVGHGQGPRIVFQDRALCMPRSIEQLEDTILNGAITIETNPVTTMCASNAVVVADAMNNRAFDKRTSRGRIDGMISITEAVGAAHAEFEEEDDLNDFLTDPIMVA
ncbi:Phage terminase-like protein, large subunit, contains N-terminal HTH domain [Kaistia soli DSM 19436]|uniref:Phage terminase-like protein, large subunit, contains N-terminal HTH domain n=1 Tax=Kaistia soli DSM 19436 TaxID=1122133 RepID=A0A1M4YGY4_9HYPH|nr:terminase TerL endonuclease subunit [Kaistia soli]SHF04949.1 Phage terminase-like protein, large subunit, contains N-terminal HTH domain [Kaistia soli DSM 19436]